MTWNTFNVTGMVDLSASSDGTTFIPIATGIADNGSYAWTVDSALFAAGSNYVVKIQSEANPAITDTSNGSFAISPPVHAYYINGQATGGDFTTTAGSDGNTGLDADDPMASLGALLQKYKLQPGDTVYVDAGTYHLTQNIIFDATQSGTATAPITIIGDGTKTIFDRGSNSGGFYDFEVKGAKYVTFKNMQLQGGQWQFYVDANAASTGITVSGATVKVPNSGNSGIHVGTGNDGFTLDGSTLTGIGSSGTGVELDGDNGATVSNSTFSNFGTGVQINGSTGSTLRGDTFINDNAATGTSFTYNLTFDHLMVSGGYYGISTYRSSGIIENSTVHDTAAFGLSADNVSGLPMLATGNTIYNIGGSNSGANSLSISGSSVGTNNTVYNSAYGIYVGGTASGNMVYGIADWGIEVDGGAAQANTVHDNTVGILLETSNSIIRNNTIYNNTTAGVQVVRNNGGTHDYTIVSNTIVQKTGTAIEVTGSPYNVAIHDNILSVASGAVGLEVPAAAQNGFSSDYNLFDIKPGGTLATWGGQATNFLTWQVDLGFDPDGLAADPKFRDPANGNYIPAVGSPAIDAGDPALPFANEPLSNGNRIDIGATGNTANAIGSGPGVGASPAQSVQILSPGGASKVAIGQQITLDFASSGFADFSDFELANSTPVLLLNAGTSGSASGAAGATFVSANPYATHVTGQSSTSATITSQIPDAAQPSASLFQTYDYSSNGAGSHLTYALTSIPDGTYALTLYFAAPGTTAEGQNTFDILVNGALADYALLNDTRIISAAGVDPYKLAGDRANTAISVTVLATASNGQIALDLSNKGQYGAFLNGLSLATLKTATPLTATVSVSTDGGGELLDDRHQRAGRPVWSRRLHLDGRPDRQRAVPCRDQWRQQQRANRRRARPTRASGKHLLRERRLDCWRHLHDAGRQRRQQRQVARCSDAESRRAASRLQAASRRYRLRGQRNLQSPDAHHA